MTFFLLATIVFLAALMQTLSGFGFALVVMPLLTLALGLPTAVPLVSLIALTLYAVNLLRYRQSLNLNELKRLALAAALGVPIGLWVVASVPETAVKFLLGLLLIAYALYSFLNPALSFTVPARWGYGVGFLSGCLGGAYNVPGPPVIVYGSLRQWPRDEFRAVLQALFLLQGILVVAGHLVLGDVTTAVFTLYLIAIPALFLGSFTAARLDARINKAQFRKLVTGLILVLGVSLII
ncbi:MAG: sulfite exporter TauE/SafE family protein [Anaerolineales bacterium]|nr:sulfite exporter TauE/SafE family protein [Anaerolineales bacterium]